MEASENLFNKQFRDAEKILELSKKCKELNAKTNKMVNKLRAKIKDREEVLLKYLKKIIQKKHKRHLKK